MLSTESGFCLGIPDVLHPTNVVEVQATVQSIREMDDGWSRYGLACADDKQGEADLSKGLHTITLAIQRQQLRRRVLRRRLPSDQESKVCVTALLH